MSTKMLHCLNCGRMSPVGASYCQFCGEAIDPALIAELQWLYGALNDLDTRIARGEGEHTIRRFASRHADHFHVAEFVVSGSDATGVFNEAVWNALTRKGLARSEWPNSITLTPDGLGYDTGMADEILHASGH